MGAAPWYRASLERIGLNKVIASANLLGRYTKLLKKGSPMLKKNISTAAALIVAVLALSANVVAQNVLTTATNSSASQAIVSSLSNLPDADELIYISPHRVLTEAAPRVLPDADLTKLRAHLSDMKKETGIDPANIDFIVFQARFKKPTAE